MKKLSREEVKHIAKLANLRLNEKEVEKFRKQLSETLSYVEKLREVKTQTVEPTSQVTGLKNVLREDEIEQERYTAKGDYFKTEAIF